MSRVPDRCAITAISLALSLVLMWQALGQAVVANPLDVVISPTPPVDEVDPGGFPIDFFDAYSWRMFVALNWPAVIGQRGVPDTTKTIVDRTAPRVWETWKSVEETFLPGGNAPADWSTPETPNICSNASELGSTPVSPIKVLADLNQGDDNGGVVAPLVAQNHTYVRYEIRMNRLEFEEIANRKLYLRDNLPKDATSPALAFPAATTNVKAAWRELRAGENSDRYYVRDALAVNPATGRCDKRQFALIGFHIGQKTPARPQWIWSTFEQVDNIAVGPGAPAGMKPSLNDPAKPQTLGDAPMPISRINPPQDNPEPVQVVLESDENKIPAQTAVTNRTWQSAPEIQGSVWRFYQLVMTQWPTNPNGGGAGIPFPRRRVANVTMETFRQPDSCIGCHFKTTQRTDFIWFLSDRAFPIKDNLMSNAKILKEHSANP